MQETSSRALARARGITTILVDEIDNVNRDADLFYAFLAKTLPKRVGSRLRNLFTR